MLLDSVGYESKLLGGGVIAIDILVVAEPHEVERESLGLQRTRVQPILQPLEESPRSSDPVYEDHSMRPVLILFVHVGAGKAQEISQPGGPRSGDPPRHPAKVSSAAVVSRDYRAG